MTAAAAKPLVASQTTGKRTESQKAKITSKGQITIPAEIRRRLGVGSGDQLIFEIDANGETRVRKADRYPFEEFLGIGVDLPEEYQSREGIIRYMREMRGWDEIDEKIFGPIQPDNR